MENMRLLVKICSFVLASSLIMETSGCSSTYFGNLSNVQLNPNDLQGLTNITSIDSWLRCTVACMERESCLSVLYDNWLQVCYISDVLDKFQSTLYSTTSRYLYAELGVPCSEMGDCNVAGMCSPFAVPRIFYQGCIDARKKGMSISGPYYIDPDGAGAFLVWCDFIANESWAVIQRRLNGRTDFYRGWTDYKNGFGDVTREYWLGLERIYRMTKTSQPKLNIYLDDFNSTSRHANYSSMSIGNEASNYTLTLGSYAGTAGDSMGDGALLKSNGSKFTTYDSEHDYYQFGNCAVKCKGAWWYSACHEANLNGFYFGGSHLTVCEGINWNSWLGKYYSLKTSIMRVAI